MKKVLLICAIIIFLGCPQYESNEVEFNNLTEGYINEEYSADLINYSSIKNYKVVCNIEDLPEGLTVNEKGKISGIPVESGIFKINISLTNGGNSFWQEEIELVINRYKMTILFHAAFDNDMDYDFENRLGYITAIIESLQSIQKNWEDRDIKILVLFDSMNKNIGFSDGYYELSKKKFVDNIKVTKKEINSGDVKTVKDFIDWSLNNYPSEKYSYIISSHGSGIIDSESIKTEKKLSRGIGSDETSDDFLTHSEVTQILEYITSNTNSKLDLFYTQACLMGNIEMAWNIRKYSKYILTSEEVFPAEHWLFSDIVEIIGNKKIDGESIGKALINSANKFMPDKNRDFDFSLIDLSKLDYLYNSIDSLSTAIISDINNISNYKSSFLYAYRMTNNQYMDIGHFSSLIMKNPGITAKVKEKANDVQKSLQKSVVYSKNRNLENCTGLSIYYPYILDSLHHKLPIEGYIHTFNFSSNNWSKVIELSMPGLNGIFTDKYEPNNDFSNAAEIKIGETLYCTFQDSQNEHNKKDIDHFKLYLNKDDCITIKVKSTFGLNFVDKLEIYDNNMEMIPYPSKMFDSSINYKVIEEGMYYIGISDSYEGPYSINVTNWLPDYDIYEPDNNIDNINTAYILNSDPQSRTLHSYNDIDNIKVFLNKNDKVKIEIVPLNSSVLLNAYFRYCNEENSSWIDPFGISKFSLDIFKEETLVLEYTAHNQGYHFLTISNINGNTDYGKYTLYINK